MKKLGMALMIVLLVGLAAGCISDSTTPSQSQTTPAGQEYVVVNGTKIYLSEIHFYMYGLKTCPHCQKMHKLIPEAYGNDSLTYYELMNNDTNMNLFREQYKITGISGVPAIAITYNDSIMAVMEGEFNVSMTPKIIFVAMQNNGTVLFVGGKAYILPHSDAKVRDDLRKLYFIFVKHEMPPENMTKS